MLTPAKESTMIRSRSFLTRAALALLAALTLASAVQATATKWRTGAAETSGVGSGARAAVMA